jgi:hypothetical protein
MSTSRQRTTLTLVIALRGFMARRTFTYPVALGLALSVALLASCGDDSSKSPPPAGTGNVGQGAASGADGQGDAGSDAQGGDAPTAGGADGAASGAPSDGGAPTTSGGAPSAACNDGKGATISGRVLAPNGALPLAGVTVYVPSTTVDPLPNGAGCWRCASALVGTPIALSTTDGAGRFEITNAPSGERVPVVVQTGKWRRQLELEVKDCQDNVAAEADTRLPRKRSEGALPRIALATGGEDQLECLLRKLGIDDTEFGYQSDGSRVQLYRGKNGVEQLAGVADAQLPLASELWSSTESLGVFDLVLLASEPDASTADKPPAAVAALHEYAAAGGRVLMQHFQSYFLSAGPSELAELATFVAPAPLAAPFALRVDESSARGKSLADQLIAAEPSGERGELGLEDGRLHAQAVDAPATRLIYGEGTVQAFSLDVPLGAAAMACGRIVATDLLTAAGDQTADFPSGCSSTGLNAQERALAYLLFDLGACLPSAP